MKYIFFVFILTAVTIAQAQQNPYFIIFEPNNDGTGVTLKNSPQKTVTVMSCDMANTMRQDSANCLEYISTFDTKGRLKEQQEFYTGIFRRYIYDDKDRVIEYIEIQTNIDVEVLRLQVTYDKKGRITQLVNKAKQGAKSVSYNAEQERLLVSETMGAIDEVYFKNGRIVKYVNRNSAEIMLFTAEYEYDKKGHLITQKGIDAIEGAGSNFLITTVFNANDKKEVEVAEYWDDKTPNNKLVQKTTFAYTDAGLLFEKNKNTPEGVYLTVFEYDETNRLLTADYFNGTTRLVKLFYYYR